MLLSELCVVTVSVPAEVTRTHRGRGGLLKFRFSPYTQIEFLRVAILKVSIVTGTEEVGCMSLCITRLLEALALVEKVLCLTLAV